jgi:anti-sigma regulatory factor (Ser/Thr protein kinase)
VRSAAGGDVDVDDLDRLLIAVTEIAGNAVRYAGGTGRITLRRQGGRLIVEITDDGPGLPADLSMERPAVTALGGRGLWLAHAMCDDITIVSGPGGVTVTMTVACRDGG